MLWESVVEWDRERTHSPAFATNPIGIIIRKTQAKIRRWYAEERRRHLIEGAVIHDYWDEWRSLDAIIAAWRKEADEGVTPRERRYARIAVKILSTIGDEFVRKARPDQKVLARDLAVAAHKRQAMQVSVAVRCGVLNEHDAALLATERIQIADARLHNRLRQRRHRARRRLEDWAASDEGRTILMREGLVPTVEDLCWLLAVASNPNRRLPQETVESLRRTVMALPGAVETWERLLREGLLESAWFSDETESAGSLTWNDLGFPEEDDD